MRTQILVLAFLPFVAGWAGENTSLAMVATRATPSRVESFDVVAAIERMEFRNSKLRNLVVETSIIVARTGKDNVELSGRYYMSGSDYRLRMKWGAYDVLDMAAKGDELSIWLPHKGVHAKGPRTLLGDVANDFQVMGMAHDARELILPICWVDGADRRRVAVNGGGVAVSVFRDGTLLRRFVLSRIGDELLVEKVIFLKDGRPIASVRYSGHGMAGGVIMPSRIDVCPSETTTMTLCLSKAKVNAGGKGPSIGIYIPEGRYEAPIPLASVLARPSFVE